MPGKHVSERSQTRRDEAGRTFAPTEDVILQRSSEARLENVLSLVVTLEPPKDRPVPQVDVQDLLHSSR